MRAGARQHEGPDQVELVAALEQLGRHVRVPRFASSSRSAGACAERSPSRWAVSRSTAARASASAWGGTWAGRPGRPDPVGPVAGAGPAVTAPQGTEGQQCDGEPNDHRHEREHADLGRLWGVDVAVARRAPGLGGVRRQLAVGEDGRLVGRDGRPRGQVGGQGRVEAGAPLRCRRHTGRASRRRPGGRPSRPPVTATCRRRRWSGRGRRTPRPHRAPARSARRRRRRRPAGRAPGWPAPRRPTSARGRRVCGSGRRRPAGCRRPRRARARAAPACGRCRASRR